MARRTASTTGAHDTLPACVGHTTFANAALACAWWAGYHATVPDRSRDWMTQAERDLQHARHARDDADHEWACFAAQQAAEKAVKALAVRLGGEPWGHSITTLLACLPGEVGPGPDLVDRAKILDKHYIQPRYPNGFDSGAPGEYYTRREADEAIDHAEQLLTFCRNRLRRS